MYVKPTKGNEPQLFEGVFTDDFLDGQGQQTTVTVSGDYYIGNFNDSKRRGEGKYFSGPPSQQSREVQNGPW